MHPLIPVLAYCGPEEVQFVCQTSASRFITQMTYFGAIFGLVILAWTIFDLISTIRRMRKPGVPLSRRRIQDGVTRIMAAIAYVPLLYILPRVVMFMFDIACV